MSSRRSSTNKPMTTFAYKETDKDADLHFVLSYAALQQSCPSGRQLYVPPLSHSRINNNDNATTSTLQDTIPRLLHVHVDSQCLPNHHFLLHDNNNDSNNNSWIVILWDDAAIFTLLHGRHWKAFPALQHLMQPCLSSAKTRALWKAVVLYQYGGVVMDDNDNHESLSSSTMLNQTMHHLDALLASMMQPKPSTTAAAASQKQGTKPTAINNVMVALLDTSNQTAPLLAESFVATPPRHGMAYLWGHVVLLETLSIRNVDTQWMGRFAEDVPFANQNYLTSAWRHWQKQVKAKKKVNTVSLQVGWYAARVQSGDVLYVVEQTTVASWLPSSSSSSHVSTTDEPPHHEPWGNTDTCLVRLYRVHEAQQAPPVTEEHVKHPPPKPLKLRGKQQQQWDSGRGQNTSNKEEEDVVVEEEEEEEEQKENEEDGSQE